MDDEPYYTEKQPRADSVLDIDWVEFLVLVVVIGLSVWTLE